MATFEEVKWITLRLREEIFSSKLKKLNEVNATVNNSRGIINLKEKKTSWNNRQQYEIVIFDTEKSRETSKLWQKEFESFIEDTKKSVKTLKVSWIWRSDKKSRQNEFDKIKFINDKNQTHQSQTSKTEALQVINFQSVTFLYLPFYQRIWTEILHDSKAKGSFLSESSMRLKRMCQITT